ncbi:MFS transporter [Acidiphilium sp. AL]|uniref:MFS transporter n=1 Tax=Acidiphilium sp. AL TaxID=2871704 RepID=UPI0021CB8621|nr:MFS transporter [Acidiphilium sp. AL]MCU4160385.1 MFS transporter [Acidiphilium sp. AL]
MLETVVIRSPMDVNRFINSHRQSSFTWAIVLIALGGIFIDAYDFTSLGIGVVQIKKAFDLTPFAVGGVTAIMAFGAFLGALSGGYFTDKVGRLRMFLVDLMCLVVAAIGAALSTNFAILLIFRFLMGIGVGLDFPVALSFISEFVAERRRGSAVNLWLVVWLVATMSTGLIILPFYFAGVGNNLWRVAVGFGAVPAFVILLLRYRFMDESPLWAARNLSLPEAARILERTYGVFVKIDPADKHAPPRARVDFLEIFHPQFLRTTLIVTIIAIAESLEYFAIGFNIPTIVVKVFGASFLYAIMGLLLFNAIGLVGAGILVAYTQRLGLRRLGIFGFLLVLVSLLTLWAGGRHLGVTLTVILMGTFIVGHMMGPAPLAVTTAALAYPTRIRGVGNGWSQSMVRIGSICGFFSFPVLVAAIGFYDTLIVIAGAPLAGLLATLAMRTEPVWHDADIEDELVADTLTPSGGLGLASVE